MFKVAFLSDVYQERPIGQEGISKIITRFSPEPNGFLHIGHSKAISINFGFAKYHGGDCYLRFDDTNPEEEEEQYFVAIEEMVRWLGFRPKKITYSSDNFDRLYELAEILIEKDRAYVCHCTKPKLLLNVVEEKEKGNLDMHVPIVTGQLRRAYLNFEPCATGNMRPTRIIGSIIGRATRMYPTYDFTHCLCDSFEGITHSLCTTEFELSRVSYEWLCDELKLYKPMQREYGRLNVSGTVLSKRKIIELVKKGHVHAWDDPRLYTLIALRRRGIPPGAILSFVNELGVTKSTSNIEVKRFETSIRRYLEMTGPRLMLILEPLAVIIDDLPDDHFEMVEVPFSKDPKHGSHFVPFTKTVFIERSDFREVDSDDYFRLAPGKTVGLLKAPFPITATSFDKDPSTGQVSVVHARYEKPQDGEKPKKPKSFIHWVASSPAHSSLIKATVRVFNPLFNSSNPVAHPDGFLADINPDSEQVFSNAMMEIGFEEISRRAPWPAEAGERLDKTESIEQSAEITKPRPETIRFQGMRVAYFCVDRESTNDEIVLNRIVSLKEDTGKD